MLSALIIVPEDLDITDPVWIAANQEVAWELGNVLDEYTKDRSPGTQYQSPTKVVHVILTDQGEDSLVYYNALLMTYGLHDDGWEIIGLQSWSDSLVVHKNVDTVKLFPYLEDRYTYDQDGNPTGTQSKQLNWMHQYQGQADWQ